MREEAIARNVKVYSGTPCTNLGDGSQETRKLAHRDPRPAFASQPVEKHHIRRRKLGGGRHGTARTHAPPQRNKKLKSLQQQLLVPASVYDRVVSTACLLPQNSITHLPNPLPATIMAADTAVGLAPDLLYANEHLAPAKTRSINSPPPPHP